MNRLPFAIKELHPDNGTEFFNQHLVRFWGKEITGLKLSRSRPYQKNDNRMVEQKNDSLVRQYGVYGRYETPEQLAEVNALYELMWVYYNLFQPVLHLIKKEVQADKVRRTWDEAKTPYQRVLATGQLSAEQQTRLQNLYEQTNPLALREEIYRRLELLWDTSAESPAAA